MTDNTQKQNIIDFITGFIMDVANVDDKSCDALMEAWTSEENQAKFIELLNTNMVDEKSKKKKDPKAPKKKKDPKAPKKNKSSYMFFCMYERAAIQKDHPDITSREVTSELGKRWAGVKAAESGRLQYYTDLASTDKERYANDINEYIPQEMEVGLVEEKKKKKKDSNAPKNARNSYIFYCMSARGDIKASKPELSTREITSEMGDTWNSLSVEEKQPFVDRATEDKKRYTDEMKNYSPLSDEELKKKDEREKQEKIEKKKILKKSGFMQKRLLEQSFPTKRHIQLGEIFGSEIKWSESVVDELVWLDGNIKVSEVGGMGYSGWDKDSHIYLRYNSEMEGQKHCFRILTKRVSVKKVVGSKTKPISTKPPMPVKKVKTSSNHRENSIATLNRSEEKKAPTKKTQKKKNTFLVYAQATRETIKKSNLSWTSKDVTKQLKIDWSAMGEEEQQVWKDKAV
jgi:hypothetical protein